MFNPVQTCLGVIFDSAYLYGMLTALRGRVPGMPTPGGFAALFGNGADAVLRDPQREAAVRASGIPHIIIKTGSIQDKPGGNTALKFRRVSSNQASDSAGTAASSDGISREDLACVIANAINAPAAATTTGLTFELVPAGPGQRPQDWQQVFESLSTAAVVG